MCWMHLGVSLVCDSVTLPWSRTQYQHKEQSVVDLLLLFCKLFLSQVTFPSKWFWRSQLAQCASGNNCGSLWGKAPPASPQELPTSSSHTWRNQMWPQKVQLTGSLGLGCTKGGFQRVPKPIAWILPHQKTTAWKLFYMAVQITFFFASRGPIAPP